MNESDSSGAASSAPALPSETDSNGTSQKFKVVGVRTRFSARPTRHLAGGLRLRVGDQVIVEAKDSEGEVGTVAENPRVMDSRHCPENIPRVLRLLSDQDGRRIGRNEELEAKAFDFCRTKISELNLQMRLIEVRVNHSSQKATFFFSADGRVDFRKLVRTLAERLSIRVEMRQIGVRDEAEMKGGCGDCGRTYCCSSFLKSFDPISVRMAKDQNLSPNPSKLSGGCGRLKCCLRFEHSHYVSVKKRLPACKKKVSGCNCGAMVVRQNLLKEEVTLSLETGDMMIVHADDLMRLPTGQYSLKHSMEERELESTPADQPSARE